MRKEFMEEIGVRKNAYIGAAIGLLLGVLRFILAVRINTNRPVVLSLALSVVFAVVVAMAVAILLTIVSWFIMGMEPEARNWKKGGMGSESTPGDESDEN
ncbi:MAG: hypothetical protein ABEK59_11845 [Halobacteria archaeon]